MREVIVTDLKTHTIHTNTIKPVNTQESFQASQNVRELASHQQRLEIKRKFKKQKLSGIQVALRAPAEAWSAFLKFLELLSLLISPGIC